MSVCDIDVNSCVELAQATGNSNHTVMASNFSLALSLSLFRPLPLSLSLPLLFFLSVVLFNIASNIIGITAFTLVCVHDVAPVDLRLDRGLFGRIGAQMLTHKVADTSLHVVRSYSARASEHHIASIVATGPSPSKDV